MAVVTVVWSAPWYQRIGNVLSLLSLCQCLLQAWDQTLMETLHSTEVNQIISQTCKSFWKSMRSDRRGRKKREHAKWQRFVPAFGSRGVQGRTPPFPPVQSSPTTALLTCWAGGVCAVGGWPVHSRVFNSRRGLCSQKQPPTHYHHRKCLRHFSGGMTALAEDHWAHGVWGGCLDEAERVCAWLGGWARV